LDLGIFALLGGPFARANLGGHRLHELLVHLLDFIFFGLHELLWDSSLPAGRPTLRTWKEAVHLCGLKNPLAFYLELLVARPRVVTRLRAKLGSHFMIFSYGLPWDASLCERVACEEA
jgi:hypothetical protein